MCSYLKFKKLAREILKEHLREQEQSHPLNAVLYHYHDDKVEKKVLW